MSRFSYKDHCYKLSEDCFNLQLKCKRLESMLAMATMVAVYSGLHSLTGQGLDDGNARELVEDLRAALKKWALRGGGPPSDELQAMVNKLTGTGRP